MNVKFKKDENIWKVYRTRPYQCNKWWFATVTNNWLQKQSIFVPTGGKPESSPNISPAWDPSDNLLTILVRS